MATCCTCPGVRHPSGAQQMSKGQPNTNRKTTKVMGLNKCLAGVALWLPRRGCTVPVCPAAVTVLWVLQMGTVGTACGYCRVQQAYAAEGMGRVRLRLRVCTPSPTRYLTFLRFISIKMARAFAEGVTISVQMGLERCGFNKSNEG